MKISEMTADEIRNYCYELKEENDNYIWSTQISTRTFPDAWDAIFEEIYLFGTRIETPKHQDGITILGWDADINVCVLEPRAEPWFHKLSITDTPLECESYRLEVIYGIHDEWIGHGWDYTYHERLRKHKTFDGKTIDWVTLNLERIVDDYKKKGRMSGRDYAGFTGYPTDNELDDKPCLQHIQWRITESNSQFYLHQFVYFRSRDFFKAWHENAYALSDLQRLMAKWLSERLEIEINVGSYYDHSSSLHIYGLYENENELITNAKNRVEKSLAEETDLTYTTEQFMGSEDDIKQYRRIIAARLDAMAKGHGTKLPEVKLTELSYDLDTFPYPAEWDE